MSNTSQIYNFTTELRELLKKYKAEVEVSFEQNGYYDVASGLEITLKTKEGGYEYVKLPRMFNASDI